MDKNKTMKKIILIILLISGVSCYGQKKAAYKYGEVDSVIQYQDAQIISYKNKVGKQVRDTIWTVGQKKDIEVELAHHVITTSQYLKPRIKVGTNDFWGVTISGGDLTTTTTSTATTLSIGGTETVKDKSDPAMNDTIPVIMLVCDTARKLNGIESNSIWAGINHHVLWMFGYEVLEPTGEYYNCANPNTLLYLSKQIFRHKEYLDENKKPLPKSTIVWMSRNRN